MLVALGPKFCRCYLRFPWLCDSWNIRNKRRITYIALHGWFVHYLTTLYQTQRLIECLILKDNWRKKLWPILTDSVPNSHTGILPAGLTIFCKKWILSKWKRGYNCYMHCPFKALTSCISCFSLLEWHVEETDIYIYRGSACKSQPVRWWD